MRSSHRRGWSVLLAASVFTALTCRDQGPEVAGFDLSVADAGTTMRFREPIVVRATPLQSLGVPASRSVTVAWESRTSSVLSVTAFPGLGDSALVSATGIGVGQIVISAGGATKQFSVQVLDTAYGVTVSPAAVNLVAGDTISFTAAVSGPTAVSKAVSWNLTNATVLAAVSSDSQTIRVRVLASGTADVRATALADTAKHGVATVSAQVGNLAFVTQPANVQRGVPFSLPIVVQVRDGGGIPSSRSVSQVIVDVTSGTCPTATLSGITAASASNGVASFSRIAVSRRCTGATLTATALPAATPATTQSFDVVARGCGDIAIGLTDTLNLLMENVDCPVSRAGATHYAHAYTFTVPGPNSAQLRVRTSSSDFSPRVESYLWAPATPSAFRADSGDANGEVNRVYYLPPGAYRFLATSRLPGIGGGYTVALGLEVLLQAGQSSDCTVLTAKGVTVQALGTMSSQCVHTWESKAGSTPSRSFIFYLPAGVPVSMQLNRDSLIGLGTPDPYLEVFDVTDATARARIGADDNSGGGVNALVTIAAAPSGRFIEIKPGVSSGFAAAVLIIQ